MATIEVGSEAINRTSQWADDWTVLQEANPASEDFTCDTVELWLVSGSTIATKAGSFYGSGTDWTNRDYESLGIVSGGSKQTFSGLDIEFQTNDLIGGWIDTGLWERSTTGGSGVLDDSGDNFGAGVKTYRTTYGNEDHSLYGSGETAGWSNIAKVNGIASASIAKVNGIAVASIAKVNGVAV